MKNWKNVLIILCSAFALSLSVTACGDDDDGNGGNNNGANAGDNAGNNGGDNAGNNGGDNAGNNGDNAGNNGGDNAGNNGGGNTDACLNQDDGAIIMANDVTAQATNCGLQCVGGAADCAKNCVVTETGLSDACSQCYADTIQCTIDSCLNDCLADPASQGCTDCQAANCLPTFYACTGLTPTQ